MSPKLSRLMLALLVSASIAGWTGSIGYLYDSAKIPSALAGGHSSSHGNNGNENQNSNGNSGVGNGSGDYGFGSGNAGQRGDDTSSKSFPEGQGQFDQTGLQVNSLLDFDGEKKSWDSYLKDGLNSSFDIGTRKVEPNFTPNDMKEEPGRNHPPASRLIEDGSQSRRQGNAPVEIDPRSYSRREVLAVDLSPTGAARARTLGFQVGGLAPAQENGPVTILIAPRGLDAPDAMNLLKENLPAEHFQLNRLYRLYRPAMKGASEPQPSRLATLGDKNCAGDHCYARAAIKWKDSFSRCAQNVKIGVIDTDIDLKHPAFRQQNITKRLFLPAGRQPSANWHGTGVLALLAGRPDSGTPGLIPEATFFAASIFYADDHGDTITDTISILRALDWMMASGTKLVNMSFSGPQDDLVQAKIENLSAKGFVFSAAAGNDGPTAEPAYPAAYPQVIAVTAVTKELKNYPYANRGGHIDVAAPGVDIWTAWPDSREGYRSGTSFASPFVTAVLAILPPDRLNPAKESLFEQLRTADLGPPGRDPVYGRGLLQAPSSCQFAPGETADNTPALPPRAN